MSLLRSISEGLKSLTISPDKSVTPDVKQSQKFLVNFEAGGELLHKHEDLWKTLYQDTEETAKQAENLDMDIGKLFVAVDKQSELLQKLHEEAANLPILLKQLQDITNVLAGVEEEYDKVEAALIHLENVCEEQEFHRNQASHHKQLAVYKMKKEHELQRYRASLAQDHAMKVDKIRQKQQNLLKEKQSAFQEQFTQDLDYYKKHGKIERLPGTPDSQKKLDIAEVDIEEEEDKGALAAFLETSTEEKPGKKDMSEGEGQTSEPEGEITLSSETEVNTVTSPDESGSQTEATPDSVKPEEQQNQSETEQPVIQSSSQSEEAAPNDPKDLQSETEQPVIQSSSQSEEAASNDPKEKPGKKDMSEGEGQTSEPEGEITLLSETEVNTVTSPDESGSQTEATPDSVKPEEQQNLSESEQPVIQSFSKSEEAASNDPKEKPGKKDRGKVKDKQVNQKGRSLRQAKRK